MNKYAIMAAVALAVAAVAAIGWQRSRINELEVERDKYRSNTETLMQDVVRYQTKDSLNAAKVGILELKLSEFERYRAEDAELIKGLRTENKELEAVTTAQMQTIAQLQGTVRDSIVYLPGDTTTITVRCVDISEPWFSLKGCATPDGKFSGTFESRDSILIAATVEYKRFLGFLWKTRKVKSREIDIVSRNPHTKIMGVEYIEIEK